MEITKLSQLIRFTCRELTIIFVQEWDFCIVLYSVILFARSEKRRKIT